METDKKVSGFEKKVHDDLYEFLRKKNAIDEHLPECPDIEQLANPIIKAYLPDGIREYQQYPVTSLGWMMFMGMSMAWYWDEDWAANSNRADWYESLRDKAGYDNLDDTVVKTLLGYDSEKADKIIDNVAECASRVYRLLTHSHIDPGTEEAFGCYVASLKQLYFMGIAIELNALGYHMTPLGSGMN